MVIIKGMEMPQRCMDCGVDTGLCGLWNGYDGRYSRRHPRCPLVEIPTPHGRLVDIDKLIDECEKYMNTLDPESKEYARILTIKSILIWATEEAVIEAEGSEE